MKSGKIIHKFYDDGEGTPTVTIKTPKSLGGNEDIIEGYGHVIKSAREKSGLPLAVIAERINEKESFLHALENERLKPTTDIAKKLEKELKIKLIEKVDSSVSASDSVTTKRFSELTLGEMLPEKKKKEK